MGQNENFNTNQWVIKDNKDHFVHKNSIGKSGKDTWMYVSQKVFKPECRWYETKDGAEKALSLLKKKRDMLDLNVVFHLEQVNIEELIKQGKTFKGESMIIYEKKITSPTSFVKAM